MPTSELIRKLDWSSLVITVDYSSCSSLTAVPTEIKQTVCNSIKPQSRSGWQVVPHSLEHHSYSAGPPIWLFKLYANHCLLYGQFCCSLHQFWNGWTGTEYLTVFFLLVNKLYLDSIILFYLWENLGRFRIDQTINQYNTRKGGRFAFLWSGRSSLAETQFGK